MEVKKLSHDQIIMLQEPLPKEAVSPHPTKTYLSSIKAIYVVERLNKVFGIGSYELNSKEITTRDKMVVVQSNLIIPEYGIKLESYGGNDNADLGDAYKGAVTDALTKMASMLEIGMNVFKGIKEPVYSSGSNSSAKPELKQFDSAGKYVPAFIKATQHIAQGGSIEQVEKTYFISEDTKKKIFNESKTISA